MAEDGSQWRKMGVNDREWEVMIGDNDERWESMGGRWESMAEDGR